MGMPSGLLKTMVRNSVMDFALGFIPFVGDIADFFYKSNCKNVQIMEKWWISNNKAAVDRATQEKLSAWQEQLTD